MQIQVALIFSTSAPIEKILNSKYVKIVYVRIHNI